jgi:1-acyl-sn-glycerol-3-phosphate acyltransferase
MLTAMLRALLVRLFRGLMRLYFRSIEELGERPDAKVGSRLFVSNHQNALIDPILVITCAPCQISPVAKSTLWKIPGLRWLLDQAKAVPIVRRRDDPTKSAADNDAVFERVGTFLAGGGNLLIFPEGTSHNEPQLQKLKTGAARMLARAEAHRGTAQTDGAPLTFQAVGLEFEARDTFRSRCVVVYGPVRRMDSIHGAEDERIQRATEIMRDDLSELLVEGGTWDERLLITRVAEMLRNESGQVSFAELTSIGRAVEAAKKALTAADPAKIEPAAQAVTAYFDRLESAGLRDEVFANTESPRRRVGGDMARRLLFPLAVTGALLFFVPYQLPRLVASRNREADMHSTIKLGVGLAVYPLWAAALVALYVWRIPTPWCWTAVLVTLISPFVALDRLEHAGSFSQAFLLLRSRRELVTLAKLRAKALDSIEAARAASGV